SYGYDALNRLTSKTYSSNLNMPSILFGYDLIPPTGCSPPSLTDGNPVGNRTSMCDESGATSWSHDTMGRVLYQQETQTGGGANTTEIVGYIYNLDGSVNTLTYPSGNIVTYTVGGAGRVTQVSDPSNNYVGGATGFGIATTYAPHGALYHMFQGSTSSFGGIYNYNVYNNRLQPIVLSAWTGSYGFGANMILSLCYDFHLGVAIASTHDQPCSFGAYTTGDNGNVFQILNNVRTDATADVAFTYDPLNRISQANTTTTGTGSNCWGEAYGVDAWGNLTNITPRSGCNGELLSVAVNTKNQITGDFYDGAGNLLDMGTCALESHSFVYDAEGQLQSPPVSGVNGGLAYTYYYDGDGKRVQKCSAISNSCTSTTPGMLYWRGAQGEVLDESSRTGTMQEEYVYFNGQRIARRDMPSNDVHYYFSDHLGSASVITDSSGNVEEQTDYFPYGGIAYSSGADENRYKFTGKERDTESGLDNFGARYDASNMGRFMTPDPLYLELHRLIDPQQLNLYAYVRNSPLSLTDATGLDITCTGDKCANYLTALQKDVSFKIDYDKNGKVETVGDIDKKSLSKSDKAFLSAIDDSKHHVTINAIGGDKDSSVFFGASHGATHTINFDQAALLDSSKNAGGMTSAGLVGHETLEGYDESKGYNMSEGHDYATGLGFPGLDPGRITGLFGNAQTGTAYGFTQQFQVHGTGTTENIRINFVTPIPSASVHSGMNAAGYPVSVEKAQ